MKTLPRNLATQRHNQLCTLCLLNHNKHLMEQQRRHCDVENCKVRYKLNFCKFLLDKGEDAYEVLVNSENHNHEGCFKKI